MLQTSKSWDEAINANARTNDISVQFQFSPDGANENAVISVNNSAEISDLEQVKDGIWDTSTRYTTLERNFWLLDGGMEIPPTVVDYSEKEIGYWSEAIADETGTFAKASKPAVSIVLDNVYDLVGMTIKFNDLYNEFATDFQILFINIRNQVVARKTVTENKDNFAVVDLVAQGVKQIKIVINKFCLPFRRCRMLEIFAGEVKLFTSKEIISFEFNDNVSIFESAFDCPNFSLTVDNSRGDYDVLNPQGVFAYLSEKMKFSAKIGTLTEIGMEWLSLGDFYLYDIPTSQQQETATFNCKPKIGLTDDVVYAASDNELTTVQHICETIFGLADISMDDVIIPASVATKTVNNYAGDNVALTDAFMQIAIAAGCFWKIHRKGTYEMIPVSALFENSVCDIDYDNSFSKSAITRQNITSVSTTANYFKTYSWNDGYQNWTSETITETMPTDNGGNMKISSAFVRFGQEATALAKLALAYYSQHPLTFQTECRGNPAVECGDIVNVETDYGKFKAILTEQKISFDDSRFLTTTMAGRG